MSSTKKNVDLFDSLRFKCNELTLYQAGLPEFSKNFTRDAILSAILLNDSGMLRDQLVFSALKQGAVKDPQSGEEPGKIFHEFPGVETGGHTTEFNACDTTALYLIGHEIYLKLTGDSGLVKEQKRNINKAVDYILSHLEDNLFIETPLFCGANRFALPVTYWKDSVIPGREKKGPNYPITYTLAHVQNMRALKSAEKILCSALLKKTVEKMSEGLRKLYDTEKQTFYIGLDRDGPISGISSDALHSLYYLDRKNISEKQLKEIVQSSRVLETPIGYRTVSSEISKKTDNGYHAKSLWPFEQAFIHMGAKKFDIDHVAQVSLRILNVLDSFPERFILDGGEFRKAGSDPQLWTVAAKQYFENIL